MNTNDNESARNASPEIGQERTNTMNHDEIRREVFLILADEPEIELTPSDEGSKWDVAVPCLGIYFDGDAGAHEWATILLRVKACKGALDGIRDK